MRIKEIAKSKGITIGELAEKLGVTRQALYRQMKGKLLVDTAERIANALGVPVWQLFVSEDEILEKHGLQVPKNEIDFVAFIKKGNKLFCASSVADAKAILDDISNDR